ncbi:hypothetical protein V3C99_005015, partial [Haemonchus contortus]
VLQCFAVQVCYGRNRFIWSTFRLSRRLQGPESSSELLICGLPDQAPKRAGPVATAPRNLNTKRSQPRNQPSAVPPTLPSHSIW